MFYKQKINITYEQLKFIFSKICCHHFVHLIVYFPCITATVYVITYWNDIIWNVCLYIALVLLMAHYTSNIYGRVSKSQQLFLTIYWKIIIISVKC